MKKLFVGGLSWGTTDEGLQGAFSRFGEIVEAKVITDRETGRSRGFGFVTFANDEGATSAITEMDGSELDGRTIKVNEAKDKGLAVAAAAVAVATAAAAAVVDAAARAADAALAAAAVGVAAAATAGRAARPHQSKTSGIAPASGRRAISSLMLPRRLPQPTFGPCPAGPTVCCTLLEKPGTGLRLVARTETVPFSSDHASHGAQNRDSPLPSRRITAALR